MNFEIFDKWWEYFLVIFWGFSHPSNTKLLGREIQKKDDIKTQYEAKIADVLNTNDTEKIKNLSDFINKKYDEEEERKKTIENKAHSLIGQTSIAVSLLLAAISIGTSQNDELPLYFKIIVWFFYFIIILNFVTAGLHARNVVTVLHGFASHKIDSFFDQENFKLNILLEKYFMSEYNSYLNDVKATYLRFSHWYFKFSFIITVLITLILPPSLMLVNTFTDEIKHPNKIENINVNHNFNNNLKSTNSKNIKIDTLKNRNIHNRQIKPTTSHKHVGNNKN